MPEGRLRRTREAYARELRQLLDGSFVFVLPTLTVSSLFRWTPPKETAAPARFDTDRDPGDETENLWGV